MPAAAEDASTAWDGNRSAETGSLIGGVWRTAVKRPALMPVKPADAELCSMTGGPDILLRPLSGPELSCDSTSLDASLVVGEEQRVRFDVTRMDSSSRAFADAIS